MVKSVGRTGLMFKKK